MAKSFLMANGFRKEYHPKLTDVCERWELVGRFVETSPNDPKSRDHYRLADYDGPGLAPSFTHDDLAIILTKYERPIIILYETRENEVQYEIYQQPDLVIVGR